MGLHVSAPFDALHEITGTVLSHAVFEVSTLMYGSVKR